MNEFLKASVVRKKLYDFYYKSGQGISSREGFNKYVISSLRQYTGVDEITSFIGWHSSEYDDEGGTIATVQCNDIHFSNGVVFDGSYDPATGIRLNFENTKKLTDQELAAFRDKILKSIDLERDYEGADEEALHESVIFALDALRYDIIDLLECKINLFDLVLWGDDAIEYEGETEQGLLLSKEEELLAYKEALEEELLKVQTQIEKGDF